MKLLDELKFSPEINYQWTMFFEVRRSDLGYNIYDYEGKIAWFNLREGMLSCTKYRESFKMKEDYFRNITIKIEKQKKDHIKHVKKIYDHYFRVDIGHGDCVRYLIFNNIDLKLMNKKLNWSHDYYEDE